MLFFGGRHKTAKFKELLNTMQGTQGLRVSKTGGMPVLLELTGGWGNQLPHSLV